MTGITRLLLGLTLAASGAGALVGDTTTAPDPSVETTSTDTTSTETTSTETASTDDDIETSDDEGADEAKGPGAFPTAKKAWIDCVQQAHALHREGAEARRESGAEPKRFDREAACGEKPHPRDFGLASSGHDDDADDDADDSDEVEGPDDDDDEEDGDRQRRRGRGSDGRGKDKDRDHGEDD